LFSLAFDSAQGDSCVNCNFAAFFNLLSIRDKRYQVQRLCGTHSTQSISKKTH
jgi:hypothetical protein